MNILITGATGFVGGHILNYLSSSTPAPKITAAVRRSVVLPLAKEVVIQGLENDCDWSSLLGGQDVIIHAAARAHIMKDDAVDPLTEYRRVNVQGTLNLARQAAAVGIKRFVFISSIKVNGEQTALSKPFTVDDSPAPEDAYALSKWEAEKGLINISAETGMELVIIRPSLVYGPGVKGNFSSLIRLVEKGVPLPLGSINNKRSLVAIDNLVDLIITCIEHPAAANQVFLASDNQDISTTELLRQIAKAMGKSSFLVPVPKSMLVFCASIFGKKLIVQRLCGSLQVDISKTRELLGWEPPISVEEGLSRYFTYANDRDVPH